jgi:hypothetical protein
VLPWWIIGGALAIGTGALFILVPTGLGDEGMSLAGRIIAGVLLVPIGLLVLAMAGVGIWRGVPTTLRRWRVARRLARRPEVLAGWALTEDEGEEALRIQIEGGPAALFPTGEEFPLQAWLVRESGARADTGRAPQPLP